MMNWNNWYLHVTEEGVYFDGKSVSKAVRLDRDDFLLVRVVDRE